MEKKATRMKKLNIKHMEEQKIEYKILEDRPLTQDAIWMLAHISRYLTPFTMLDILPVFKLIKYENPVDKK